MASVFGVGDSPCGVFAAQAGTQQTLSFARAAHLYYSYAPIQNARGELVLSYIGIGSHSLDLQPATPSLILRQLHGVVNEVSWRGFLMGRPDIQELDRCYDETGLQLEVIAVAQYGDEQCELDFRSLGR